MAPKNSYFLVLTRHFRVPNQPYKKLCVSERHGEGAAIKISQNQSHPFLDVLHQSSSILMKFFLRETNRLQERVVLLCILKTSEILIKRRFLRGTMGWNFAKAVRDDSGAQSGRVLII
jgi:hypothetical protein